MKVQIEVREVARYLGLRRGHTLSAEWREQLEKIIKEAEGLVEPGVAWRTYRVAKRLPREIRLVGTDLRITGPHTVARQGEAAYITALSITCGPALEEAAAQAFAIGEYVRGAILDAAGSAAAESLADEVNALVRSEACAQGYSLRARVSPGYGDWSLDIQPQLRQAAGGDKLGITLNEALLLVPRKSITAVIAWTQETGVTEETRRADSCRNRPQTDCRYRKE